MHDLHDGPSCPFHRHFLSISLSSLVGAMIVLLIIAIGSKDFLLVLDFCLDIRLGFVVGPEDLALVLDFCLDIRLRFAVGPEDLVLVPNLYLTVGLGFVMCPEDLALVSDFYLTIRLKFVMCPEDLGLGFLSSYLPKRTVDFIIGVGFIVYSKNLILI